MLMLAKGSMLMGTPFSLSPAHGALGRRGGGEMRWCRRRQSTLLAGAAALGFLGARLSTWLQFSQFPEPGKRLGTGSIELVRTGWIPPLFLSGC